MIIRRGTSSRRRGMYDAVVPLVGAMLMGAAAALPAAAQTRQFALFKGDVEPFIQASDAFMKNFNKDVQVTVNRRHSDQEDGVSLEYFVIYTPPVVTPFNTAEKRPLAVVGIRIHRPRTARAGTFITEGPEAERVALSYAFQWLQFIHRETTKAEILESELPASYMSLERGAPKDPRFDPRTGLLIPPGTYFSFRTKERMVAVAANVTLDVSARTTNYDKADSALKRPDPAELVKLYLEQIPAAPAKTAKPPADAR